MRREVLCEAPAAHGRAHVFEGRQQQSRAAGVAAAASLAREKPPEELFQRCFRAVFLLTAFRSRRLCAFAISRLHFRGLSTAAALVGAS